MVKAFTDGRTGGATKVNMKTIENTASVSTLGPMADNTSACGIKENSMARAAITRDQTKLPVKESGLTAKEPNGLIDND